MESLRDTVLAEVAKFMRDPKNTILSERIKKLKRNYEIEDHEIEDYELQEDEEEEDEEEEATLKTVVTSKVKGNKIQKAFRCSEELEAKLRLMAFKQRVSQESLIIKALEKLLN